MPKAFHESFSHRARRCDHPGGVVAPGDRHWDELFPRVAFIVTNMTVVLDQDTGRVIWMGDSRQTAASDKFP